MPGERAGRERVLGGEVGRQLVLEVDPPGKVARLGDAVDLRRQPPRVDRLEDGGEQLGCETWRSCVLSALSCQGSMSTLIGGTFRAATKALATARLSALAALTTRNTFSGPPPAGPPADAAATTTDQTTDASRTPRAGGQEADGSIGSSSRPGERGGTTPDRGPLRSVGPVPDGLHRAGETPCRDAAAAR